MLATKVVWSLVLLLVTGCASSQGFDRPAMIEALHVDPASISDSLSFTNQDIRLSPPLRLGVFFTNQDFPYRPSLRKVEWLTTDREQLFRQLAPLRDEQILGAIFVLMDATLRGENIQGIRQSGARYGADLVLIVDGAAAVDRYNNRSAWLYPTVIGAYLAPGTESRALVMITGSLWATHSEWHTPIQIAEGVAQLVGPAVLTEDNAALREAKEHALQAICQRIVDQLRLGVENVPRSLPPSR
ncbi:MAG: hypothetical protein QM706_07380 [Nitrospira sp.]